MTISDEKLAEIKTAAWNCDRWPEWLFDLAEVVSTWALDSDASQEQASGLAALLAIEMQARRATPAGVTVSEERALRDEIERLTKERDQALEAEDEAKDCFWAVYPHYLESGGEPISTEAARTTLAERADALHAKLGEAVSAVRNLVEAANDMAHSCNSSMADEAIDQGITFLTEHIDGDVLNSAGKSNMSEPGAINGGLRGERQAITSGGGNG